MITWDETLQEVDGTITSRKSGTCLSDDTKPLNVGNGSILLEMDTSTMYLFDLKNKVWRAWV